MSFLPQHLTLSPLLLFGLCLLGGMASGELSRRVCNLPRTTGYVLFGVAMGESGLRWIDPFILASAQFFIYPALGLILFELGQHFPLGGLRSNTRLLLLSLAEAGAMFAAVALVMVGFGFGLAGGLFAGAIAVATSPAITIATCSDVGGEGPKTRRLFGLVALNGGLALGVIGLILPLLAASGATDAMPGYRHALFSLVFSIALGAGLAQVACRAAVWLGPQPEHQHLMLLGLIVIGTGLPLSLGTSPLLSLLAFGIGVRIADREGRVVAIRIASDARVFMVVTFVLAGAALELHLVRVWWVPVLAFALVRFLACWAALGISARWFGLSQREAWHTALGLLPMSSVALVLLGDAGSLDRGAGPALAGTLAGGIALMQLLGPLCTQTAVRGFGEARRYVARRPASPGGEVVR